MCLDRGNHEHAKCRTHDAQGFQTFSVPVSSPPFQEAAAGWDFFGVSCRVRSPRGAWVNAGWTLQSRQKLTMPVFPHGCFCSIQGKLLWNVSMQRFVPVQPSAKDVCQTVAKSNKASKVEKSLPGIAETIQQNNHLQNLGQTLPNSSGSSEVVKKSGKKPETFRKKC